MKALVLFQPRVEIWVYNTLIMLGKYLRIMASPTPDWNEEDLEICKKYDEKVRLGKMGYTKVKVK